MTLNRQQWIVMTTVPAILSALCFGRVGYMLSANDELARTIYEPPFDQPRVESTPEPKETPDRNQRLRQLLDELRKKRLSRVITKPWSAQFEEHQYDWEEIAPWLFSAVVTGGLSAFLYVTGVRRRSNVSGRSPSQPGASA